MSEMSTGYIKARHRCHLPPVRGSGDLWRCECGRVWRSVSPGNPAYDRWARLTWLERALRGIR